MNSNKNLKNLLDDLNRYGLEDYDYIGLGNPNSKILFVGKEAGEKIDYTNNFNEIKEKLKINEGSAFKWKTNNPDYTHNPDKLKDLSQTWRKYQKLYEYIYEDNKNSEYATFLKEIFTTEMSNLPSETTDNARKHPFFKEELFRRKNSFFRTEFIQSFPVVVLACSDYIENNDKTREIDDIFKVRYFDKSKEYSKGNQFFIHYGLDENSEGKRKLVIHTRNLSGNVNNDLLKDMGKLIQNHLKNKQ